ncbi:MAG: hypothetical protein WC225_01630 [Acholeplasmataceae bacterium]
MVALGTGVFAWFSMNTKTEATGLNGSAEAATGGFYISMTGAKGSWGNVVELNTLPNKGFRVLNDVFTDLTSTDGIIINKIDFEHSDNAMIGGGASAASGYMEFPLYFLTGNDYFHVYLTKLEFVSQGLTSWSAEKDVDNGAGRVVTVGDLMESDIINAIRVSFQEVGWAEQNAPTNDASTAFIFEQEASGDNMGANPKLFGNTTGFGGIGTNFALLYYNAVNPGTLLTLPNARGDIVVGNDGVVSQKLLETTALGDASEVADGLDETFTHGGKVMVRVWLEGWDQEAFNALFGGEVTINMTFEVDNQ